MFAFLKNRSTKRQPIRKSGSTKTFFRPRLEALEDRCVPAVVISYPVPPTDTDGNLILRIVSNSAADVIVIDDNGDADVDVTVNGTFEGSFEADIVDVRLGGGNDILNVNLSLFFDDTRSYLINTGSGHDTVGVNCSDAGDPCMAEFSSLEFQLTDGGGNDTYNFTFDTITGNSVVEILARTGGGNDIFTYEVDRDMNDSASVHLDLDMGSGNDQFHLDQEDDVEASGLFISLKTGSGNDVVNAFFSDEIDDFGIVNFDVFLDSGNDRFVGTFDGDSDGEDPPRDSFNIGLDTPDGGNEFKLNVFGDKGNDFIGLTSTDVAPVTVNATFFDVHMDGGDGNDEIVVDLDSIFIVAQTTDSGDVVDEEGFFSGSGLVAIIIDGGKGNDKINVRVSSFDPQLQGEEVDDLERLIMDIEVLGGLGNDEITFFGYHTDATDVPFFEGGDVLLDGGLGTDKRIILPFSNYPRQANNFEILG